MKINLKSAALASFVGVLLGGVSYGACVEAEESRTEAVRSRASIAECFSPEARAAINNSGRVFRSYCSSVERQALDSHKQALVASLLALQQHCSVAGQQQLAYVANKCTERDEKGL